MIRCNVTKTCPCIINRDFLALKIVNFSAEFVLSFSYFCSKHRFKGVCISRTYFPDGLVPGKHLLPKCENSIVHTHRRGLDYTLPDTLFW